MSPVEDWRLAVNSKGKVFITSKALGVKADDEMPPTQSIMAESESNVNLNMSVVDWFLASCLDVQPSMRSSGVRLKACNLSLYLVKDVSRCLYETLCFIRGVGAVPSVARVFLWKPHAVKDLKSFSNVFS